MRNCNSSNLDGEVQNIEVMTPNSDFNNQFNEYDVNEFWEGDAFNFATGRRSKAKRKSARRKRFATIGEGLYGEGTIFDAEERARRRERRQARKDLRVGARTQAKTLQAQAQSDIAKSLGDPSADIALAQALKTEPTKEKKGLSTGAIVGIVFGGLLVGGLIFYLIKKQTGGALATTVKK